MDLPRNKNSSALLTLLNESFSCHKNNSLFRSKTVKPDSETKTWVQSGTVRRTVSLHTWISERSCRDVLLESCFSCRKREKKREAWERRSVKLLAADEDKAQRLERTRSESTENTELITDSAHWCAWKHPDVGTMTRAELLEMPEPKQTAAREAGGSPAHLHMSHLAWGTPKEKPAIHVLVRLASSDGRRCRTMSVFLAEPDADRNKKKSA